MIPKKIHYCWFGKGELPKLAKRCKESWKKYCPDYEIIEWNEDSFDVNRNPYTKWCYENKKYAFLSDYARLVIVEQEGGIYFDTDVELVRPLDSFLDCSGYIGFETRQYVNTGLGFGAQPHNKMVGQMLREYDRLLDGEHGVIGCPILNTEALLKYGLKQDGSIQQVEDMTVYPIDYFNPFDAPTGICKRTNNTVSIHWFAGTWMSGKAKLRARITRPFHRLFGTEWRRVKR